MHAINEILHKQRLYTKNSNPQAKNQLYDKIYIESKTVIITQNLQYRHISHMIKQAFGFSSLKSVSNRSLGELGV